MGSSPQNYQKSKYIRKRETFSTPNFEFFKGLKAVKVTEGENDEKMKIEKINVKKQGTLFQRNSISFKIAELTNNIGNVKG